VNVAEEREDGERDPENEMRNIDRLQMLVKRKNT
jgi:hypothetical protein